MRHIEPSPLAVAAEDEVQKCSFLLVFHLKIVFIVISLVPSNILPIPPKDDFFILELLFELRKFNHISEVSQFQRLLPNAHSIWQGNHLLHLANNQHLLLILFVSIIAASSLHSYSWLVLLCLLLYLCTKRFEFGKGLVMANNGGIGGVL